MSLAPRRGPSAAALVLALLVTSLLAAYACGGGGGDKPSAGTQANGGGARDSYDVFLRDSFFDPKDFTVNAGAKVTFKLTNAGNLIHNMRIAGADNQYGTGDDVVSEPQLIQPGGTSTVVWTAPSKTGTYDVRCDIHPALSVGKITVQ